MMMMMHFFGDRQSHLIACSFKQCWFAMPNGLRLWHKDGNPPNARYGSERSCIAMVMMGVFSSSTIYYLAFTQDHIITYLSLKISLIKYHSSLASPLLTLISPASPPSAIRHHPSPRVCEKTVSHRIQGDSFFISAAALQLQHHIHEIDKTPNRTHSSFICENNNHDPINPCQAPDNRRPFISRCLVSTPSSHTSTTLIMATRDNISSASLRSTLRRRHASHHGRRIDESSDACRVCRTNEEYDSWRHDHFDCRNGKDARCTEGAA